MSKKSIKKNKKKQMSRKAYRDFVEGNNEDATGVSSGAVR